MNFPVIHGAVLMLARIAGMLLITAASGLCGLSASAGLAEKKRRIRALSVMTSRMSVMIEYRALKTSELLDELAADEGLSELAFLKKAQKYCSEGYGFAGSWRKAAEEDPALGSREINYLVRLGCSLGKSGVSGQTALLAEFCSEAGMMYEEACRVYDEKGKLYRSFGILAGAFISVLLV